MTAILIRLGVLLLACLVLWLLVWAGRRFVETQRKKALAAPPLDVSANALQNASSSTTGQGVRILAFSTADCKQCHQLQRPALQRVQDLQGDKVTIVEIDATAAPDLVKQYHVLTVPTTVVIDATGHPQAINYGFANSHRLLEQVDAVMGETMKIISS